MSAVRIYGRGKLQGTVSVEQGQVVFDPPDLEMFMPTRVPDERGEPITKMHAELYVSRLPNAMPGSQGLTAVPISSVRKAQGWIGVDLDNTLSYDSYGNSADTGRSPGEPVPRMLDQVRRWLDDGWEVRIFTARHSMPDGTEKDDVVSMIQDWTERHLGVRLPVTCKKDQDMVALFDDRAYHVVPNTGQIVPTPEPEAIVKSEPSSSDVHVDGPLSSAVGFPKNPRKSRPTVIRRIRPR